MTAAAEATPPLGEEVPTTDSAGSDFMVDVIKSLGFEYICANPGSSFRGLHESVINYGGNQTPELITCCHEESSVATGHGYFKVEGKPLAVMAHGTVGLQHAAMAIYNAWCDRVPVYIILGNYGDAATRRGAEWYHGTQDVAAMVRDYTKWDDTPWSLGHFAESAVRAYRIGMTPPMAPVVIVADSGPLQGRHQGPEPALDSETHDADGSPRRRSRGRGVGIKTSLGTITDSKPMTYQEAGGRRTSIDSRFVLGAGGSYSVAVGSYDATQQLVVDPGLAYSTFLGGGAYDASHAIAVDASGSAYVTGQIGSADFPTTPGAYDTTLGHGPWDAFVTKLDPTGTSLVYSTYLGGLGWDWGRGIAVDALGHAHVSGMTSGNFPTTPGAYDTTYGAGGAFDAFVTKLGPSGTSLVYSTYLGGTGYDAGGGIALDAASNAYVSGATTGNFPTTIGAFDTTYTGNSFDIFVTKLNPTGSTLVYSTYLGGSGNDQGGWIAVDATGSAHVTGFTDSTDFPTTPGAFDESHNGGNDVFVTKLNPLGSAPLVYSTYLGGTNWDQANAIALDGFGNAYVTGFTSSANFPTTPGAFDPTYNGGPTDPPCEPFDPFCFPDPNDPGATDAFVTKINPVGSAPLAYSTYLGGSDLDHGHGIAVDASGAAHVTGDTSSADFPTTPDALDTTYNGGIDAFVTRFNAAGSAPLAYSTYLGVPNRSGLRDRRGRVQRHLRHGPDLFRRIPDHPWGIRLELERQLRRLRHQIRCRPATSDRRAHARNCNEHSWD